jgi:TonB family protein
MAIGEFHPWILLPRGYRDWEPQLLKAVLLHERAHIRRRDCLVQWLPNLVCALHWFNPLAWLARSEALCQSERACDDAVILGGVSGSTFARDLIEITQSIRLKGDSFMSTAVTTKLERRIRRLLNPAANRRPLTAVTGIVGAVTALALLAPLAGLKADQTLKAPTVNFTPEAKVLPKVTNEPIASTFKRTPRVAMQIPQAPPGQPTASSATGLLSGIVTDPTGAVVAGATVEVELSHRRGQIPLTMDGRGAAVPALYLTTSNSVGQWSFPALPAGSYTLEIAVPGFKAFNRTISVAQGANDEVKANLAMGRASESVTVTAERPNASAALTTAQPAAQASSKPIRVSAGVQPAKLIRHPSPVFPQSARAQGMQGSVTFEALIDKAGFIKDTPLLVSDAQPELVQAALDAIKQWQYTPALLNGEPVEILTEITVNFTLQ